MLAMAGFGSSICVCSGSTCARSGQRVSAMHVSTVSPGLVDTPIYDKVEGFERARQKIREQVPTWLTAEDVAEAIVWIASRPPHLVVSQLTLLPSAQAR